tara:strand:+ start:23 stop:478 length:456 start_codon:yes stop_codon:yes gene_type:complete
MGQMKKFKELYEEDLYCGDEELDKVLDELTEFRLIGKAQRRKIARRMARLVKTAGFKKKVERSKKKIASFAKQKVKAAKLAKQKVIDKFFPSYKKMSLPQRVKTDQKIQARYGGMINKLSTKLMRVVKKKEIEKVAAFRKKASGGSDGVDA